MKELVSVIITTYKRADLLPRAVHSVLNQTYSNVEVIIVDDNTPDSEYRKTTEAVVNEQFGADPRVVYCKMEKNSGSCAARNVGVRNAKGVYLNFLDDDDELLPEKIEKQVKVFEESKDKELSVVGCFAEILDGNNNILNIEKSEYEGDVFFNQLCQNLTTTSLALIRKDYYIESGGFEKMYSSQEHWMFAKIYAIHPNYKYVPEVLVRIYHHEGERISTNPNKPLGAIDLYNKIQSFLPRFNAKQVRIINNDLLANIVDAFLNQNRRIEAWPYLIKKIKCTGLFSIDNMKYIVRYILGVKLYGRIIHRK